MNYSLVSALASLVTALAAVVALLRQNKAQRFSSGVDLLFRLDEKFNGPDMLKMRAASSRALLDVDTGDEAGVESILDLDGAVYEGLSEDQVGEIERIALKRGSFFPPRDSSP